MYICHWVIPDQELFIFSPFFPSNEDVTDYSTTQHGQFVLLYMDREVKRSEQRYHTKAMVMSSDVT